MMETTENIDLAQVARDVHLPVEKVRATVELLDDGNTVPFITRYRKDRTGGLDEEQIRLVQQTVQKWRALVDRKQRVVKSLQAQGKLTDELAAAIEAADSLRRLEDLYLPFKPKKQTLANLARGRGLEPLAQEILVAAPETADLNGRAAQFVEAEKGLATVEEVLQGAGHLIAERYSENLELRDELRKIIRNSGKLVSTRIEDAAETSPDPFEEEGDHEDPLALEDASLDDASLEDAVPENASSQDAADVEDAPPGDTADDVASAEDAAPAQTAPATQDASSAEDAPAVEDAALVEEAAPVEDPLPTATATTSEDAGVEEAAPPAADTSAEPPSQEESPAPVEESPPAEGTATAEEPAPAEGAASAEEAASTADAAPEQDLATGEEIGFAPPSEQATADPSGVSPATSDGAKESSKRARRREKKLAAMLTVKRLAAKSRKESKKRKREQKIESFKDYFDYKEPLSKIPPHRLLAINRGDRSKILRVKIEVDTDALAKKAEQFVVPPDHPHAEFLRVRLRDALHRLILPSLEREVRRELTEYAELHAVQVFARNLRKLLLQPPVHNRRVLAIDPGFRSGCKLAALDEFGNVLGHTVMHVIGKEEVVRRGR